MIDGCLVWTYTKYPPDIHEVLSLAPSAFPMIDKLAARVVWSIKATRSTVEHARKIYIGQFRYTTISVRSIHDHTVMMVLLGT